MFSFFKYYFYKNEIEMNESSFPMIPLIFVVVVCVLLLLQSIAIKSGRFVKVEYSKPKRLFWAVLISLIVASNTVVSGELYFLLLAVAVGFYLYFFKQYYAIKR